MSDIYTPITRREVLRMRRQGRSSTSRLLRRIALIPTREQRRFRLRLCRYREARRITIRLLRSRNPDVVLDLWRATGVPELIVNEVAALLRDCYGWETFLFIPDDCASCATDLCSDSLASALAESFIQDHFPLAGDQSFSQVFAETTLKTVALRFAGEI